MQLVRNDYRGECSTVSAYRVILDKRMIGIGNCPRAPGFETEEIIGIARVLVQLEELLDKHKIVVRDESGLFETPLHDLTYGEAKGMIAGKKQQLAAQLQRTAGIYDLGAYLRHVAEPISEIVN
jgi:hypothetical protein